MTLHRTYRTPELALHLSAARALISDAREWFNHARTSLGDQDHIDRLVDYAHNCRKDARRHLAIVVRRDSELRAVIYQELASDAYRHADQLRALPDAYAVMARQAAYYSGVARDEMRVPS